MREWRKKPFRIKSLRQRPPVALPPRNLLAPGCSAWRGLESPEVNGEARAMTLARARGLHAAAVHFDEPLDDRQSNAEAAARVCQRLLALHEQIEDLRQDRPRYAGTVIAHHDRDPSARLVYRDPDFTDWIGLLHGVVQQVADALNEPRPIAEDEHPRGQPQGAQPLLLLPEKGLHGLDRLVQDLLDRDRL